MVALILVALVLIVIKVTCMIKSNQFENEKAMVLMARNSKLLGNKDYLNMVFSRKFPRWGIAYVYPN